MIDVHTHVLPGIDDGPETIEGSIALAEAAAESGTRILAATPHVREDHPGVRVEELAERCIELNQRLQRKRIDIEIVVGAELDVVWALDASHETLALASYAQRGTDLLVETPYGPLSDLFEDALFRLSSQGFRLVLAHPERNRTLQREPERIADLVGRGVLVQVTAGSLVGTRRSRTRQLASRLIREGLAHIIASDAHTHMAWRSPDLREGVATAGSIRPRRAWWMVTDAPAAVLRGASLPEPPNEDTPRGATLRRWFQRG